MIRPTSDAGAEPLLGSAVQRAAWTTLLGLFLAGFLAYGIGVYGFTQFLEPITREYGWDRATLGGMMSAFWVAAPFVLLAGASLDRLGLRVLLIIGAVTEALGFALMAGVSTPWEAYLVRLLAGIGKVLIATPIPITIARWFRERNGTALAVALAGWHVGGLAVAPLTATLITQAGWRMAALLLAAGLLGGMLIAVILVRDPPGYRTGSAPVSPAPSESLGGAPLPVLLAIGLGTLAFYAGYAALLSHLAPWLADAGFESHSIALLTADVATVAVLGALGGGVVARFMPARMTGAVILLVMALVELSATIVTSERSHLPVFMVIGALGLLIGGGDPILIEALRRAVPLREFRRAYACWYLLCLAMFAIAPVAAGVAYDRTSSYRLAFETLGGLSLLAATAWSAFVRLPGSRGRTRAAGDTLASALAVDRPKRE